MDEKQLIALVDCDVMRFRCGFAADGQMKREALVANPGATNEELAEMLAGYDYQAMALQNVKTVMEHFQDKFNPELRSFIHGGGNFRYDIATLKPYKGNRDKLHKPKYFNEITDYLIGVWRAEVVEGIESDDAIGIAQCAAPPDSPTVICSNDKDMDMIPGWHYNWVKSELYHVSDEEANLMLFWQMLVGDTSDNIPGIRGTGPVGATTLIEDEGGDLDRVRSRVINCYKVQYGDTWQEAFEEVAKLLWIQRKPNEVCPYI